MSRGASVHQNVSEQLHQLAATCRQFILDNPSPERIALSYLHVRNAHPSSLEIYADLLNNRSGLKSRLRVFAKTQVLKFLALYRREELFFGDSLPEKADILFISHFTNRAQAGSGADNYFGDLPKQMKALGISSVIAHVNHTWMSEKDTHEDWCVSEVPRVILGRTTQFGVESVFAKTLQAEGRKLSHQAHETYFAQNVASQAALNATNSASMMALRTAAQITELVTRLQPKFLVTTFEGHAWERLVFHAVRSVVPDIKCVGYHHAILFPHQHALGTRLGHGYDPDAIMTAGEISRDWFRTQEDWSETPIETLGSVRTPKTKPADRPNKGRACLVVPEGLVDEAVHLFRLAVSTAHIMPEQPFRLRLHPVLSRDSILSAASDLKALPPNVVWSDCGLEEDLKQSRSALYRGSTVSITAVLSGLRPIYAAGEAEEVSIDPLEDLKVWRRSVTSPEMLQQELVTDIASSDQQREREFVVGREYCRRYFSPLSVPDFFKLMKHLVDA